MADVETAYWIVAGLLTLFYLYSGGLKVLRSREQLRPMMAWVDDIPLPVTRTVGTLEVLGALGLVVPPLTGVAPAVAVAAAVGLVLVQLGALGLHLRRGEVRQTPLNVVLLALAAVAVWLATVWS